MDNESLTQAQSWAEAISMQVLNWTWQAFDRLLAEHLRLVNVTQPLEDLERDLTSKHFICINQVWAQETSGHSSVTPHHEFPEHETRPPAPGRPPAYDLGFIWNENQRVAWPIEAKVVKSPGSLAAYMGDVQKYLTGTAAPLIGQGALIAYLLTGQPAEFFKKLEPKLKCKLETVHAFFHRPHRMSCHGRSPEPILRLHHMVMVI